MDKVGRMGLWLGVLGAALCFAGAEVGTSDPAPLRTLGVAWLMACWWVSEAIPIPATALVPLFAFPTFGIAPVKALSASYGHPLLMLFLGGFMMALAIERWGLHQRLALATIGRVGTSPRRLLAGFMVATAGLSMWISNTATTLMVLPIAIAVLDQFERRLGAEQAAQVGLALMLGIAYAANIGGLGTPIGTPPNVIFLGVYHEAFPEAPRIGFLSWMLVACPLVVLFVALVWVYLVTFVSRLPRTAPAGVGEAIDEARASLGRMSAAERRVAVIFALTAAAWVFRSPIPIGDTGFNIGGWSDALGLKGVIDDSTVAIAGALAMFLTPAGGGEEGKLLDWETAVKIPWGLILLFGGGIALARGFQSSGLSEQMAGMLATATAMPQVFLIISVALSVTFLTEVTSNTATTTMLMPVLAATAAATSTSPLALMLTAALSASCAFMLPVATAPNAIVFGTNRVPIRAMARAGFAVNLVGAVLITALMQLWGIRLLG